MPHIAMRTTCLYLPGHGRLYYCKIGTIGHIGRTLRGGAHRVLWHVVAYRCPAKYYVDCIGSVVHATFHQLTPTRTWHKWKQELWEDCNAYAIHLKLNLKGNVKGKVIEIAHYMHH